MRAALFLLFILLLGCGSGGGTAGDQGGGGTGLPNNVEKQPFDGVKANAEATK